MKKVVLAYSGGLDTSVAVAWLRSKYRLRRRDPDGRRRRRLAPRGRRAAGDEGRRDRGPTSSTRKDRFVRDFVWPHLQANALYQDAYPLATALARPLIAQLLVEVARREGADAVAHGCTGKGNDQVRFDVAVHALDPGLEVVAPMRVGMGLTRDQEIEYAEERGIEIPITRRRPTRSTSTSGAGRARRASSRTRGSRRRTTPTSGRSRRRPRRTRSRSSSSSRAGSRSRSTASGSTRSTSSSGSTSSAARTASAGSTTSRTASSGSRAGRSTRRRRRRSSTTPTARSRA